MNRSALITKVVKLERSYEQRLDADARAFIDLSDDDRDPEIGSLHHALIQAILEASGLDFRQPADAWQAWFEQLRGSGVPAPVLAAMQAKDAAVLARLGIPEGEYADAVDERVAELTHAERAAGGAQ